MIALKKAYRVKRNSEFQEILRTGKSFANRELVIYYKKANNQEHFRIGISVGKKIGNAVTRNRIKRLIREAFTQLNNNVVQNVNIIIIARKPTIHMDGNQMKRSVSHLLNKQGLLK